jgi:hypothetical protein
MSQQTSPCLKPKGQVVGIDSCTTMHQLALRHATGRQQLDNQNDDLAVG